MQKKFTKSREFPFSDSQKSAKLAKAILQFTAKQGAGIPKTLKALGMVSDHLRQFHSVEDALLGRPT